MKPLYIKSALFFAVALSLAAAPAWPQAEQQEVRHHGMMHAPEAGHPISRTARLAVSDNPSAHELTLRIGPVNLPPRTNFESLPQPPTTWLTVPFSGWLTAYHPSLVDSKGQSLPGRALRDVAFFNTARPDLLCPDKEERIFAAGPEMSDWPAVPGYGYRVHKGDRIRITAIFDNSTSQSYREAFLQVRVDYQLSNQGPAPKDVYPVWFGVMGCAESAYDLPAGVSTKTGGFDFPYSGKLLNAGGLLRDYGQWLVLKNVTSNQSIAALAPSLDPAGGILSVPIQIFAEQGGIPLHRGDRIEITDAYSNPTAKPIHAAALGVIFGYFLPDDPSRFSAPLHPPAAHP